MTLPFGVQEGKLGEHRPRMTRAFREGQGARTCAGPLCRASGPTQREGSVIEVRLDENDRLDHALKLFKRKIQKAGLLKELRQRRHYVKPSAARQLKAAAARRRKRRMPER
jgi:small subunit ribosomal protein S21